MVSRLSLLPLLSLVSILLIPFLVFPVDALARSDAIHARHSSYAHSIRRRRSADNKKCVHRPSSVAQPLPTSTSAVPPATKPTTTHTPPKPTSSSTQPSNNAPGNGKIGLAWYNGNDNTLFNFVNPSVTSLYTWNIDCPDITAKAGLECVPMLWGQKDVGQWQKVAGSLTSKRILGFNEVNEPRQANLTVSQGISLWRQNLAWLRNKGHLVGCPSTSSNPNGLTWVKQFLEQCPDCDCDFIPIHFYDNTIEKFKAYVNLWHNTFPNKKIWVTEFACQNFNGPDQPSLSYSEEFMKEVTSWMDGLAYVEKYFAFGLSQSPPGGVNLNAALMGGDGRPNALGKLFLGED